MSGKPACEDGQTESRGAPAEFLVAFSHIEKWRASEEAEVSYHHLHEEFLERHQIADAEVTRIWTWMAKDLMDTDISQTD